MDFKQIKSEAKEALVGNRLMFLVAMIVVSAITGAVTTITFGLGGLIAPVFTAGLFYLGKELLKREKFDFNYVFQFFKDLNHALRLIGTTLIVGLIIFGGTLLFIIPGIIFSFQYSQAVFIMAENKDMNIMDSLRESKRMMKGYKFDYFIFGLSFIGHVLLGIITLGIYMLYVSPYIQLSMYNYYLHLKEQQGTHTTTIDV